MSLVAEYMSIMLCKIKFMFSNILFKSSMLYLSGYVLLMKNRFYLNRTRSTYVQLK